MLCGQAGNDELANASGLKLLCRDVPMNALFTFFVITGSPSWGATKVFRRNPGWEGCRGLLGF
jgi:hypothetical protein